MALVAVEGWFDLVNKTMEKDGEKKVGLWLVVDFKWLVVVV